MLRQLGIAARAWARSPSLSPSLDAPLFGATSLKEVNPLTTPFVKALFVVATPTDETPTEARFGLRVRSQAMTTGRCACGCTAEPPWNFPHEADCPAISDAITEAILSDRVRWAAVPALIPSAR